MKYLSKIQQGWFSEICPMWEGVALSLQVDEVLYSNKSQYQQIDLYQTRSQGRMLVLDGIIQLTERDEFGYQEMMAHLPLFAHPNPETVLVIGGGDGGVLREIVKHSCVNTIDFCEIDPEVIEVAKKYLPGLARGFDDPRVEIHIQDGNEFVAGKQGEYDVIIVDSSDPVGPGEALFEKPFYENLKQALKPGGVVATQGESFYTPGLCGEPGQDHPGIISGPGICQYPCAHLPRRAYRHLPGLLGAKTGSPCQSGVYGNSRPVEILFA